MRRLKASEQGDSTREELKQLQGRLQLNGNIVMTFGGAVRVERVVNLFYNRQDKSQMRGARKNFGRGGANKWPNIKNFLREKRNKLQN